MRDVVAGFVAVLLLLVAFSLATTLQRYRRRRQQARDSERALGRTIIAELPAKDDLVLVSEDGKGFYYGDRSIDKDLLVAVRMLINGAPLAEYVSRRHAPHVPTAQAVAERGVPAERPERPVEGPGAGAPGAIEDPSEGIARDRWDVAVETLAGSTLVECGAIRERVSYELARAIFDAIRREIESRDQIEPGTR